MNPHDLGSASLLSLSWHRLKRRPPPPESPDRRPSIFKDGRNVWRQAHANRVSFLIDADAFFRAFAEAAVQAERELIIVGWDTDSRTQIPWPAGFSIPGVPFKKKIALGDFLTALVENKPDLRIYVLSWDFAFIYLLEREALPGVKFSALGTDRIRFVLDKEHPFWASHHQKIVVVDDRVAFTGGLDLTQRRWDTREHRGQDQRRVDPTGQQYGPFHDVQVCLQGPVARCLGDLVRERWRVATGEALPSTSAETVLRSAAGLSEDAYWPPSARVHMRNVAVGVARTEPIGYTSAGQNPKRCVREVERLFLDSIRSARRFIYIENQYFTSKTLARALAKRLEERDGPDIVMILPRYQTGWIEEGTMGLLRSEAIRMVQASDRYGRFKAYFPVVPDLGKGYLKIHSKVMIVDDVLVRIGSANLNSRSMGLDTECDVAIEAAARADVKGAIAELRADLLGEHLGVEPAEFEARFKSMGSLLRTVESFRGGERDLLDIPLVPEWVHMISPPGEWLDPAGPKGIRRWFNKRLTLNRDWLGPSLVLGVLLLLLVLHDLESAGLLKIDRASIPNPVDWFIGAYAWLRSWDADKVASWIGQWRGSVFATPLVILFFTVGSFLFVPITAMILGVALAYPKEEAVVLALGSSMVAALATYGLGRYWAWSKSRFLARPWIQRISRQMERGGVWVVLFVRLAPVAPFTAVSIVAGGLRIRLRDYMIGTFLGLLPGSLALTLLSKEAAEAVTQANWVRLSLTILAMSVFFLVLPRFLRRLRRSI